MYSVWMPAILPSTKKERSHSQTRKKKKGHSKTFVLGNETDFVQPYSEALVQGAWKWVHGNVYMGMGTWEWVHGNVYMGMGAWEWVHGNVYMGMGTWE